MERDGDGVLRFAPPAERSPLRLVTLDEVRGYIGALDLGGVKARVASPVGDGGLGWSVDKADYYDPLYRNWLYLRRKHEGEVMPPHADVDELWHGHILDTYAYFADCDRIFGYYFHHFPYFGTRGEQDRVNLYDAWANTQRRYKQEFGDSIYDYVEDE